VCAVNKKKPEETDAVTASYVPATTVKARDHDGAIPSEKPGVQITARSHMLLTTQRTKRTDQFQSIRRERVSVRRVEYCIVNTKHRLRDEELTRKMPQLAVNPPRIG
jgi:hypothetical protein